MPTIIPRLLDCLEKFEQSNNIEKIDTLWANYLLFHIGKNKYKFDKYIGRGGEGILFLVDHLELKEKVVIKIGRLACQLASQKYVVINGTKEKRHQYEVKQNQDRFIRGARLQESLRRDIEDLDFGTIPVIKEISYKPIAFYTMEFIEDAIKSSEWVKDKEEIYVYLIFENILKMFCEIHALGGLHSDIKPSNILIRKKNAKIVLVDFNMAKMISDENEALTVRGDGFGTPGFRPPEMHKNAIDRSFDSETYQLGVTMWCLFMRKNTLPYEKIKHEEKELVLEKDINMLSLMLPRPIRDIFIKSVSFKRSDRFKSTNTFLLEFQKIMKIEGIRKRLLKRKTYNIKKMKPKSLVNISDFKHLKFYNLLYPLAKLVSKIKEGE